MHMFEFPFMQPNITYTDIYCYLSYKLMRFATLLEDLYYLEISSWPFDSSPQLKSCTHPGRRK